MKERSDDIRRRAAALRSRRKRADVATDLQRLLGTSTPATIIAGGAEAAALVTEFRSSHEAIESAPSLMVRETWDTDDRESIADSLHRLSGHLGSRVAWLLLPAADPLAVSVNSDDVLDNPFGFAALDPHQLRVLDRELPAALWLLRHEHHFANAVTYSWELEVWGEPWTSAATRALREAG